jgi:hypothetical protein
MAIRIVSKDEIPKNKVVQNRGKSEKDFGMGAYTPIFESITRG